MFVKSPKWPKTELHYQVGPLVLPTAKKKDLSGEPETTVVRSSADDECESVGESPVKVLVEEGSTIMVQKNLNALSQYMDVVCTKEHMLLADFSSILKEVPSYVPIFGNPVVTKSLSIPYGNSPYFFTFLESYVCSVDNRNLTNFELPGKMFLIYGALSMNIGIQLVLSHFPFDPGANQLIVTPGGLKPYSPLNYKTFLCWFNVVKHIKDLIFREYEKAHYSSLFFVKLEKIGQERVMQNPNNKLQKFLSFEVTNLLLYTDDNIIAISSKLDLQFNDLIFLEDASNYWFLQKSISCIKFVYIVNILKRGRLPDVVKEAIMLKELTWFNLGIIMKCYGWMDSVVDISDSCFDIVAIMVARKWSLELSKKDLFGNHAPDQFLYDIVLDYQPGLCNVAFPSLLLFYLNLEDKVLLEDGGNVMNEGLANFIWDPGIGTCIVIRLSEIHILLDLIGARILVASTLGLLKLFLDCLSCFAPSIYFKMRKSFSLIRLETRLIWRNSFMVHLGTIYR